MIGNDIVDLLQAKTDSNWQRKGFLDRIFSEAEKQFILYHKNPETIVWVLWSMKEAAYKIYNREKNIREFAPLKIVCEKVHESHQKFTSEIIYHNSKYYTQSQIFENYVHSIATKKQESFKNIIELIIPNYPTDYENYLQKNNLLPKGMEIYKNDAGIPFLIKKNTPQSYPVSISHHGKFLAIVYETIL